MAHQLVLQQRPGLLLQVVPHEELGEREVAEIGLLDHIPAAQVGNRAAEQRRDLGDVQVGRIGGQSFELGDRDAHVVSQLLEERRIDPSLLVAAVELKRVTRRLASQCGGDQEQGRHALLLAAVALVPGEKPEGDVEGIAAALLKALARRAIDGDQSLVELITRQVTVQHALVQPVVEELLLDVFLRACLELGAAARVCLREHRRLGLQRKAAAIAEQVRQRGEVRAQDARRLFGLAKVEQPVAESEVQKPALPHLDAGDSWLGGSRCLGRRRLGGRRARSRENRRSGLGARVVVLRRHLRGDREGLPVEPRRQGKKPLQPRCVDVDTVAELACVVEVPQSDALRLVERNHGAGCRRRRVEGDQTPQLDHLAEANAVVGRRLGDLVLHQPDAGKRVPFDEEDQRKQPGVLHARRKKDRKIQARPHSPREHLLGSPDLLSRRLEAGGRIDVGDVEALEREVNGLCLRASARRVTRLVAVESRVASSPLEQPLGQGHGRGDDRVVGQHERAQELGHRCRRPLVVRQEVDVRPASREDRPVGAYLDDQLGPLALGGIDQTLAVEDEIDVVEVEGTTGRNLVDPRRPRLTDSRLQPHEHLELAQRALGRVGHRNPLHQRNRVVHHRVVQLGCRLDLDVQPVVRCSYHSPGTWSVYRTRRRPGPGIGGGSRPTASHAEVVPRAARPRRPGPVPFGDCILMLSIR